LTGLARRRRGVITRLLARPRGDLAHGVAFEEEISRAGQKEQAGQGAKPNCDQARPTQCYAFTVRRCGRAAALRFVWMRVCRRFVFRHLAIGIHRQSPPSSMVHRSE
jgi:hypothetical protein